jgi:hypothetical protein
MRTKIHPLNVAACLLGMVLAHSYADAAPVVSLDFDDYLVEEEVELNGAAAFVDVEGRYRLRLTQELGERASVWLRRPFHLPAYTVEFDFEVARTEPGDQPADGFTFAAQTFGPIALGDGGGGLGYTGIPGYSFAVEFNTYSVQGLRDHPETVAIDILGTRPKIGQAPFPHIDHGVLHAKIAVRYEAIEVVISGGRENLPPTRILTTPWWIQFDTDQPMWLGFTGGTGGLRSIIDILNLTITPGT